MDAPWPMTNPPPWPPWPLPYYGLSKYPTPIPLPLFIQTRILYPTSLLPSAIANTGIVLHES